MEMLKEQAKVAIPTGTFLASWALLFFAGRFVGSSTFSTTNGLWKAIEAQDWISGNGTLNTANLLFIGVFAVLVGVAELYEVLPTEALVVFNSFSVALTAAILSSTLYSFTGRARWALFGALGFILTGGSLTHALGSEDIAGALPIIALIVRVFLLRGRRPLPLDEIALLGALLAFLHLWEWRAALPLYLALLFTVGPGLGLYRGRRLRSLAALAAGWSVTMFVTYAILVQVYSLELSGNSFVPPDASYFARFLAGFAALAFPAKGIGTIWGGFSLDKIGYQLIGMVETVVGGRNVLSLSFDYSLFVILTALAFYLFTAVGLVYLYRRKTSRGAAVFFGFVLGGALLLNLYSQPQDPQMQVTQLPVLLVLAPLGLRAVMHYMGVFRGSRVEKLISWATVAAFVLVSATNFQGSIKFWTSDVPTDRERSEEARAVLEVLKENDIALIGNGWETEVTWLAFEAGRLNFLGHSDWENQGVNALFAIDFISSNPDGTPDEWACAAAAISAARDHPNLFPISDEVSWNFDSFQTIVPLDTARKYQAYWGQLFVENQEGFIEVDRVVEAEICRAKS